MSKTPITDGNVRIDMAGGDIEVVPAHVCRKLELRLEEALAAKERYSVEKDALQNMFGGSGWAQELAYLKTQLAVMTQERDELLPLRQKAYRLSLWLIQKREALQKSDTEKEGQCTCNEAKLQMIDQVIAEMKKAPDDNPLMRGMADISAAMDESVRASARALIQEVDARRGQELHLPVLPRCEGCVWSDESVPMACQCCTRNRYIGDNYLAKEVKKITPIGCVGCLHENVQGNFVCPGCRRWMVYRDNGFYPDSYTAKEVTK